MTEALTVSGAGAWSVPKAYSMTMMIPDGGAVISHRQRVAWAVTGIQNELARQGRLDTPGRGTYGPKTQEAVRRFQRDWGISGDGAVGPITASWLWKDFIEWWETLLAIPDRFVWALIKLESNWDPGAEGSFDADDRGIAQLSRKYNPDVSDEIAYSDVPFCLERAATRMRAAYDSLGSWDPAIANWNNPSKARQWSRDGVPPDQQIADYVRLIRERGARCPY